MKSKYDILNPVDRVEILARADSIATSKKIKPSIQSELKDGARVCRLNPDHLGNWEQLLEDIELSGQ